MATGYYLLDTVNPHGKKYYPGRKATVRYIVIHTAENLPDLDGPDTGAEGVARYLAGTDRDASAHEAVDTDSFVPLLPDDYTAWHAKGANADGWGLEICTQAARWGELPGDYQERLYLAAASRARRAALALEVPMVRTTFGGAPGFVSHAEIDPKRRSDPGKDFDWDRFLALVCAGSVPVAGQPALVRPPDPSTPMHATGSCPPAPARPLAAVTTNDSARLWQTKMRARGWSITPDGVYGSASAEVCRAFQAEKRLVVDGVVGPQTWAATWRSPVTG